LAIYEEERPEIRKRSESRRKIRDKKKKPESRRKTREQKTKKRRKKKD
jgi:hypothetical protein